MNLIAEQALARAMARGARAIPAAEVLPTVAAKDEPATVKIDRLLYIEGRRHALDIVRDSKLLLGLKGGPRSIADRLRRCMQGRPASFAKGVAEIVELVEREVDRA